MSGGGFGFGGIIEGARRVRLESLERKVAGMEAARIEPLKSGAERLTLDAVLTRRQVAAYFSMSVRQVQRWEAAGNLQRCPGLGVTVRYRARDVLRLASAR